ncbi:MAG: hypothetical protein IKU90_03910 [Clostridia bacterium]|nr:hypothetical protein [Clostridia bacterium]
MMGLIPHLLSELHDREFGNIGEVVLDERTVDVFEGGVVVEVQLHRQVSIEVAYDNLLGALQTLRIAGVVLDAVQGKGTQILGSTISLINMNVSRLNRLEGGHRFEAYRKNCY